MADDGFRSPDLTPNDERKVQRDDTLQKQLRDLSVRYDRPGSDSSEDEARPCGDDDVDESNFHDWEVGDGEDDHEDIYEEWSLFIHGENLNSDSSQDYVSPNEEDVAGEQITLELKIPDAEVDPPDKDEPPDKDGTKVSASINHKKRRNEFESRIAFLQKHGCLSEIGHAELLFQDSHKERFFLIDGDSLLLDATLSETWQKGQQLHLVHLIELTLKQYRDHGSVFRVVFFKDFSRFWNFSPLFSFYREALIRHLRSQCGLIVYTEWSSFLDTSWSDFLSREKPEFFCLHSGSTPQKRRLSAALEVMAYHAMGQELPLVFMDTIFLEKTNLYGVMVSSSKKGVRYWNEREKFFRDLYRLSVSPTRPDSEDIAESKDVKDDVLATECQVNSVVDVKDFMKELLIRCVSRLQTSLEGVEERMIIHQWCLYFAVMSEKSLSQRLIFAPESHRKDIRHQPELHVLISCLHSVLFPRSEGVEGFSDAAASQLHLSDLIDSAVFDVILEKSSHAISEDVKNAYVEFLKALAIPEEAFEFTAAPSSPGADNEEAPNFPPLAGKVISAFAGELLDTFGGIDRNVDGSSGNEYEEKYHWHALKRLKDTDEHMEEPTPTNAKSREKSIKTNQKYYEFMKNYGRKLIGDKEPKTIITQKVTNAAKKKTVRQESNNASQVKLANNGKPSKKAQAKPKSKKEQIIEQNTNAKKTDEIKKIKDQWRFVETTLESTHSHPEKIKELERIIALDKDVQFKEPHQKLLSVMYEKWKEGQDLKDAATLVEELQKYAGIATKIEVNQSLLKDVVKYFLKLGFEDTGKHLHKEHFPVREFPTVRSTCPVGMSYQQFQMSHMGNLMSRDVRLDPDERVEGFIPDTWQRELLDAIDKNESALIVAPTSSGKTFCSYYCIEKVLTESNDGIVVYVAPTKALVNQVSATIYARYLKSYKDGKVLTGTFTRDYKHNVEKCQVLVTVPQCLEILLVSPKRQAWVKNVKYVILDEVHCLGGEIGGEVWEHIILMIQCPFLALSATIGDPTYFHGWLKSIAQFKNSRSQGISPVVNFVLHNERYSDIEMSVFNESSKKLEYANPGGFLDSSLLAKKGFPECLKFSASETQFLLATAVKTLDGNDAAILEQFKPEKFFDANDSITRSDARTYETDLKNVLEEIMNVKTIEPKQNTASALVRGIASNSEAYTCSQLEKKELLQLFPSLVDELRKEKKIPVIVFRCDRGVIEALAGELRVSIEQKLQQDENLQQLLMTQNELKSRMKDTTDRATDKKRKGEDPESRVVYDKESKEELEKCNLAIKRRMSRYVLVEPGDNDYVEKVIEKATERMQALLRLGIGYHHAGCSTADRRAVEMLFRTGKIQVVIATSTLALGIHMPCKSVVFVDNDHYVDALGFRQMSGRSGRRGFDNVGHVVFFGVPHRKVSKLIEADITLLKGRHPITLSFILRLFLLVHDAKDEDDALLKTQTALENPFLSYVSPTHLLEVKLYFLFCSDLMFRQGLIDLKGNPLGYAGLVTHLHYHSPGHIFMVELLEKGVFDSLCITTSQLSDLDDYGRYDCKGCKTNLLLKRRFQCQVCVSPWNYFLCASCYNKGASHGPFKNRHEKKEFVEREPWLRYLFTEETLRDLVEVLCHLFCKKRIPRNWLDYQGKLIRPRTRGSTVVLPPMSEAVDSVVTSLNQKIRDLFVNFLRCVTHVQPQMLSMPFTKRAIFRDHERPPPEGVSVIGRLSGCVNSDMRNQELPLVDFERLLPHDTGITSEYLPCLNTTMVRNSYALDFFKHGSAKPLSLDNGMKSGDIFESLKDFFLTIKTISTALEQMPEHDMVSAAFKHLAIVYEIRLQKDLGSSMKVGC